MKKGKKSDYDLNMNDYSQIYDYNQRYVIAISNRKKTIIITITITSSNSYSNIFIFSSNNSNSNYNKT